MGKVGEVFETFQHLWRERTVTAPPAFEAEQEADSQARADSIRDMRVFVGTVAYRDLRLWLDREIDGMSPKPEMGSDVASCYTFKREGLIASRQRLDAMVRLAEEKLGDG